MVSDCKSDTTEKSPFCVNFQFRETVNKCEQKNSPHSEKTKVPLSCCERGSFTFQKWLFCTLKEALLKCPFQPFDYQ